MSHRTSEAENKIKHRNTQCLQFLKLTYFEMGKNILEKQVTGFFFLSPCFKNSSSGLP